MIKTVLFDLDGVVIKGKEKIFSQRLAEELDLPNEVISEFFLNDFRECSFGRADLKEKIAPYLPKWNYKGTVEDLLNYWFESDSVTDKKVLEIVDDLRSKGVICYIATRQEKYRKEYLLNQVGLKDHFDGIFCTCDIGYDKWQSEYWDHVFKTLNAKPEEIMFFCDGQKNVDLAKNLGINSYFYEGVASMEEKTKEIRL